MTPNSEWTDIGREVQGDVAISNGASIRPLSGENDPREGGGRQLIAFNWAVAKIGDKEYRVNGQHSSAVLSELNGEFPQGLKVHMDTYEVDSNDGLALLFRQFDSRKSGHTPTDVSGAYHGLYTDLAEVNRGAAKLAVEGVAWFDKHVEGLPAPKGDDIYTLFGKTSLHSFIKWVGDLFTIKTPELRRQTIVAAMYGTFENNEDQARRFCRKRGFLALDKLAHPAARPRGKSCRRPSTLANATTV